MEMLCSKEKGARQGPLLISDLALWDTDGVAARSLSRTWVKRETIRLILDLLVVGSSKVLQMALWSFRGMLAALLCLQGQHICRCVCVGVNRGHCTRM